MVVSCGKVSKQVKKVKMTEKVMLVGTKSFPFEWRLWWNTLLSERQWGLYPSYFWYDELKNANTFFKNHLNLTKRAAKFGIFNHSYRCYYYNKKTNDYHCLLQFGMNCNSTETMSTERWKQLEMKTKDWKVLDKFGSFWQKKWDSQNWKIHADINFFGMEGI